MMLDLNGMWSGEWTIYLWSQFHKTGRLWGDRADESDNPYY